MEEHKSLSAFARFAKTTSRLSGQPITFGMALLIVAIWALTGPIFRFSDTWQLVINTGTTIITFLMVFLIQNTQNRDSEATQLKLDELIRAVGTAKNSVLDLEELDVHDLDELREEYLKMAAVARMQAQRRQGAARKRAAAKKAPK